jgi:hypothetical protein
MQSDSELEYRYSRYFAIDGDKDPLPSFDDKPDDQSTQPKTPEMNPANSLFGVMSPDNAYSMDAATMVDTVLGGFASSVSDIGRGVVGGFKVNNLKIKGDDRKGGILKQLIDLILGVVKLPVRFLNLFKSITYAGAALGMGIGGISKSFALGTKDLYILIVAILKIIFKYALCIASFWITTTFGGCIFVHIISLMFVILHLCIAHLVDKIHEYIGLDFTFVIDDIFEYIKWPTTIQSLCYTCFGKPVKLRDVLVDVKVIEDIGNKISYDFTYHMPRYMKPAIPFGKKSLKNLDKAMN